MRLSNFFRQFPSTRIFAWFDLACKHQEAGMGDHAVGGADAVRLGLEESQQDLTDFDEGVIILTQSDQRFFHLVKGRDQAAQKPTGFEGIAHLSCKVIRIGDIEEEGVRVGFIESILDVAQLEVDARFKPEAGQVFAGQVLDIGFHLVGDDLSLRANRVCQGDRHRTGTGSRFDHFFPGTNAHRHKDKADVFRVEDLRGARQVDEQIAQRGLQQIERRADVTEDLRAPLFADQVVVHQDAAVGFELSARFERDDEMFVAQPDQLGQVAVARDGGIGSYGHASILP